mmetsp:Transcript_69988/g.193586  ORF Transcript_69988/g.193586 Transcript_69988/m.193586 type:complete len:476 (+) Transcript_69988:60-1487(+)
MAEAHPARLRSFPPPEQDDGIREARAKLAAMRADLADLKRFEGRLQQRYEVAVHAEEQLKGKLAWTLEECERLRQAQRQDIEGLFYAEGGMGSWEGDFRHLWQPLEADKEGEEKAIRSLGIGAVGAARQLRIEALLTVDATAASSAGAILLNESPLCAWLPGFATAEECRLLIELGFRTCRRHNQLAQEMQRPGLPAPSAADGGRAVPEGAAAGVGTGRPALRGVATARLNPAEQDEEGRCILEVMQRRVASLTGIPVHDDEIHPFLKFDLPGENPDSPPGDDLNIGLHLDTNGGFPHCACSVILYLDSCDAGRTVFPAFRDERSRELGARLAAAGHTHTSHSALEGSELGAAAAELVARASEGPGALRVAPCRGAALLFFTLQGRERTAAEREACDPRYTMAPAPDPRAWHGGTAVGGRLGKWTLQIFKEVPLSVRDQGPAKEAQYVAELRDRLVRAAPLLSPRTPLSDLDAMD